MLREEMRQTVVQLQDAHRDFQIKADQWDRERSTLNSTLASLESQLSNAPSQSMVESMQRELRVLKRLEYNAEHDSTDDTASECREPEIAGGSTEDATELEAVLIAKVRRAEKDLIAERNSKTDLENSTRELQKALTDAEKSKEALDQLVASLEKDLERAIATPASLQLPIQQFGSSNSQQRLVASVENPAVLEHILDPTLPPPDTRQKTTPTAPVGTTTVTTETTPDDHSVATIVMAQRDRLRARCEALEAERDSFKRELQGQVQASESLKADNTKLYEKVRYLHNYSKLSGVGSGNLSAGGGKAYLRSGTSGGGDRDLDLEALEQRYEASVDPFKQFNKSERQRKLDEMSPMERTVFVVAKTVLCTLLLFACCSCYCSFCGNFSYTRVAVVSDSCSHLTDLFSFVLNLQ